ncbi:MAG TPA: PIG-L family deacetylase [Chloroflexota bacterium]|nr:PIG-L family deacetylase [Chloroflexota bacterium]
MQETTDLPRLTTPDRIARLIDILARGTGQRLNQIPLHRASDDTVHATIVGRHQVVVVAPHPDDETFACAGAIDAAQREGRRVAVIFVTSGERCSASPLRKSLAHTREKEAVQVLESLGLDPGVDVAFLRYPDASLTELANIGSVCTLGSCPGHGFLGIERFRYDQLVTDLLAVLATAHPEIVYLPDPRDAHDDHRATYQVVQTALKRAADLRPALRTYLVHYLEPQNGTSSSFATTQHWLVQSRPLPDEDQALCLSDDHLDLHLQGQIWRLPYHEAKRYLIRLYQSQAGHRQYLWFADHPERFWTTSSGEATR